MLRMRKGLLWVEELAIIAGLALLLGCGSSGNNSGGGNNGGGGGGNNPPPQIISLDPAQATAGGPGFTLTVTGTGFVSASVVNWNGTARTTTFQSATVLTAAIGANDIAVTGSAAVTVVSPESFGSVISGSVNFPIKPVVQPPPTSAGVIALVSAATDGTPGNAESGISAISANARFVAFSSTSSNFTTAGNNGFFNIFLRDTCNAAPTGCTPSTVPVSVAPDGSLGNGDSGDSLTFATYPAIGADGRYVAFASNATNLVANDSNAVTAIFLRDTCIGAAAGCTPATTLVSVASDGTPANGNSLDPSISSDGRFVVFDSDGANLVGNDTNGNTDVFLRDTCIGAPQGCTPSTVRLSVASDGTQGNDISNSPAISGGGRYVAFQSFANNLVANGPGLFVNIYVRDTCFGAAAGCTPGTSLISLGPGGALGNDGSTFPTISGDGRFITFASFASNLVAGGTTQGVNNVFVRDSCAGVAGCTPATNLVSLSSAGAQGNGASGLPTISSSGRFIAFNSDADNLVIGDTNGFTDVFVRDTCIGAPAGCTPSTVIVSIKPDAMQGNFNSSIPSISADGHFLTFGGGASNFVPVVAPSDIFLAKASF